MSSSSKTTEQTMKDLLRPVVYWQPTSPSEKWNGNKKTPQPLLFALQSETRCFVTLCQPVVPQHGEKIRRLLLQFPVARLGRLVFRETRAENVRRWSRNGEPERWARSGSLGFFSVFITVTCRDSLRPSRDAPSSSSSSLPCSWEQ